MTKVKFDTKWMKDPRWVRPETPKQYQRWRQALAFKALMLKPALSEKAVRVFVALLFYTNSEEERGLAFMGKTKLALRSGVDVRTTYRAIHELIDAGLVGVCQRYDKAKRLNTSSLYLPLITAKEVEEFLDEKQWLAEYAKRLREDKERRQNVTAQSVPSGQIQSVPSGQVQSVPSGQTQSVPSGQVQSVILPDLLPDLPPDRHPDLHPDSVSNTGAYGAAKEDSPERKNPKSRDHKPNGASEKKEGAPSPWCVFDGKVIKATTTTVNRWNKLFPYVDILAELKAHDEHLAEQPAQVQEGWRASTEQHLEKRNAQEKADAAAFEASIFGKARGLA